MAIGTTKSLNFARHYRVNCASILLQTCEDKRSTEPEQKHKEVEVHGGLRSFSLENTNVEGEVETKRGSGKLSPTQLILTPFETFGVASLGWALLRD